MTNEDELRAALDEPVFHDLMRSLVTLVDAPEDDDNVKVRFVKDAGGVTITVRTEGPEASVELVLRVKP